MQNPQSHSGLSNLCGDESSVGTRSRSEPADATWPPDIAATSTRVCLGHRGGGGGISRPFSGGALGGTDERVLGRFAQNLRAVHARELVRDENALVSGDEVTHALINAQLAALHRRLAQGAARPGVKCRSETSLAEVVVTTCDHGIFEGTEAYRARQLFSQSLNAFLEPDGQAIA